MDAKTSNTTLIQNGQLPHVELAARQLKWMSSLVNTLMYLNGSAVVVLLSRQGSSFPVV